MERLLVQAAGCELNEEVRGRMQKALRARTYRELFGCKPSVFLPPHSYFKKYDERFLIDILV